MLKNIDLDDAYLTEQLSDKCPGLSVRTCSVDKLEINLSLRENHQQNEDGSPVKPQSSLAWRAMKLGSFYESFPAVSLLAEVKIDGIHLELDTIDLKERKSTKPDTTDGQNTSLEDTNTEEDPTSKSVVGSYIEAALATLQLNVELTNVHIKFCHRNKREAWVVVKLSSFSYGDVDVQSTMNKTLVNKKIEFSSIVIETGETKPLAEESSLEETTSSRSTVALAEGTGHVFLRVFDCRLVQQQPATGDPGEKSYVQKDIEVRLNHQFNFSVDNQSLLIIQKVMLGFNDVTEANVESEDVTRFRQSSMRNNPHLEASDLDREDLKALTGIMRQYREAYHMAEQNKIKGGILVPSNAYLDEGAYIEESDDQETFDLFFDANDQSFYNATSILMKNTRILGNHEDYDEDLDHVHTKLRINLLSASVKVNFRHNDRNHQFSLCEEYVLATINGLGFSITSTQRMDEILLDITHVQIEDTHLIQRNTGASNGSPAYGGAVEIGRVLSWAEDDSYENDGNSALVAEAPCLSAQWKNKRSTNGDEYIQCSVTLLPLELSFRQRTMTNIALFASIAQGEYSESVLSVESLQPPLPEEAKENYKEVSLLCDCPSIRVSFPLEGEITTAPLFERCGEIASGRTVMESSVEILFENTGFEFKSQKSKNATLDQPYLSGKFWCRHMGLFAVAPKGERGHEVQMLRKDIFIASGRLEVNPSIPISCSFIKVLPETNGKHGRESFPIVPAISSFKARQEDDDDEDEEAERSGFSKVAREDTESSRKDLKGSDPQIAMLANSETSSIILTTTIPEFIVDMTTNELEILFLMLSGIQQTQSSKPSKSSSSTSYPTQVSPEKISVALNLDKVSLSIQNDTNRPVSDQNRTQAHSFLLAMDRIRFHAFALGSEMKHIRVFSQDLCLHALHGKPSNSSVNRRQKLVEDRFKMVKNMMRDFSQMSVVPILFRSHMFTPISQETPSFLVDLIDLAASKGNELKQKRIYVTLYHLTHRYDADFDWIEQLSNMFPTPKEDQDDYYSPKGRNKSTEVLPKKTESSMTRLFVSCADINVDYKPPSYFETESKSIIRIGDFRLSSNIMKPSGLRQACNISIGDVTYHITSNVIANQYNDENRHLCRYSMISKAEASQTGRNPSLFGTMPEAILRELDFVNVLSLDSMDATVIQRNESAVSRYDMSREPPLAISLALGTLSIHACKDSFTCFASSVGELQAKLTALTAEDMLALKTKSSGTETEPAVTRIQHEIYSTTYQDTAQQLFSDSKIPMIESLLDGHEWTTVDKGKLSGLVIPPGDEQISGWYSTDQDSPTRVLPHTQIITQHFPLHIIADPLAEGDMGARALVEKGIDLSLKSRLSIQKLNVVIRFFDGYDWPEKCSSKEKEAVKRLGKTFVIEPLPRSTQQDQQKEKDASVRSSVTTTANLMGDLLDVEDNMFEEVPLPEDRVTIMNREKHYRLSKRRPNTFFQLSLNGVALRIDSYEKSQSHLLQSILEVSVSNLFIAETVSGSKPLKMIGEWTNDYEHPRDTRFGTVMLTMATWAPNNKITTDDNIASDECNVTVQLVPMRCLLDQRAISFMKAFFNNEDANSEKGAPAWSSGLYLLPPPFFKTFKIKPWKVKVDYYPTRIDVTALREGSIVELVNLSPIQRMVITLDEVVVRNSLGFGPVLGETVSSWIKEICATQLHKFLSNAQPFEPFTDVGQGLTDLVILPYEAFKQGDSIQRAMQRGMKSLAETVVFQTLATTSGLTKIAAGLMADSLGGTSGHNDVNHPLPSRPLSIPKGIGDARMHAAKSLSRGLNAANYKVVVVPYREYLRNGVTGAVTSVIKGIPVLLVAPLTGATEAASYTLLGARNALRPDLRREEEASML